MTLSGSHLSSSYSVYYRNCSVARMFKSKRRAKSNEVLDDKTTKKVKATQELISKGDWDTAETLITSLLKKHKRNAQCCYLAAQLCVHKGQPKVAEKHFKAAIALNPDDADYHCAYGEMFAQQHQHNEAEGALLTCLELQPNHERGHFVLAKLYDEQRREYKRAEQHYRAAIQANRREAQHYTGYARLLDKMGRARESQKQFEFALTIAPKNHETLFLYAKLLEGMEQLDDAVANLKQAIRIVVADPALKSRLHEYQQLLHVLLRSGPKPPIIKRSGTHIVTHSPLASYPAVTSHKAHGMHSSSLSDLSGIDPYKVCSVKSKDTMPKAQITRKRYNSTTHPSLNVIKDRALAADKDEDVDDVYYQRALTLYRQQQHEKALGILQLVVETKPNHKGARALYNALASKGKATPPKPGHRQTCSSPIRSN